MYIIYSITGYGKYDCNIILISNISSKLYMDDYCTTDEDSRIVSKHRI